MAKTRDMTRKENNDASSMERIKRGVGPWSDLNDDVLDLVMMRLGVVDFLAFRGVCKSWRSHALSNKKRFMAPKPPMVISISTDSNEKEGYLEYFQKRRKLKTIIPYSSGRTCLGITCGYLILFRKETSNFWLVNPITSHQLHFPSVPVDAHVSPFSKIRGILVFSASLSGWLFVFVDSLDHKIWYKKAGKGAWNHVSSTFPICHSFLPHAFKGKIYTISADYYKLGMGQLCEIRFDPEPKLTLLRIKDSIKPDHMITEFLSNGENLYVYAHASQDSYKVYELDFGEMKWVVCPEKTKGNELESINHIVAIKRMSWWSTCNNFRQGKVNMVHTWYFPHECLNVNLID